MFGDITSQFAQKENKFYSIHNSGEKNLSHTTHLSKHWFGDLQAKMHLHSISSFCGSVVSVVNVVDVCWDFGHI